MPHHHHHHHSASHSFHQFAEVMAERKHAKAHDHEVNPGAALVSLFFCLCGLVLSGGVFWYGVSGIITVLATGHGL